MGGVWACILNMHDGIPRKVYYYCSYGVLLLVRDSLKRGRHGPPSRVCERTATNLPYLTRWSDLPLSPSHLSDNMKTKRQVRNLRDSIHLCLPCAILQSDLLLTIPER